jgi:hypothetical protein
MPISMPSSARPLQSQRKKYGVFAKFAALLPTARRGCSKPDFTGGLPTNGEVWSIVSMLYEFSCVCIGIVFALASEPLSNAPNAIRRSTTELRQ